MALDPLVFALVRGVNDAFGVFFVAILEEFGWSRAALAGVFSCARFTEGTISVAVGMLSDRFGLRRLVPLSACLVALGLILGYFLILHLQSQKLVRRKERAQG